MGNIARRSNGAWRARFRDDSGKEHARHFKTKVQAQRWLDEQTTRRLTGTFVDPRAGRIKFSEYFHEWLALQRYEDTTRKAVILAATSTTFCQLPMDKIRARQVEAWVTEMHRVRGLAPGTIKTRFAYVRRVFRAAVRDRIVTEDPTDGVRLPEKVRLEASMRVPTVAEVGSLLNTADREFGLFIALCAFAGLRLGEAAALRVDDVDFLGRTLHVRRQVQRLGGGQVDVRYPKARSIRRVPIADGLADLLSEHMQRRQLLVGDDAYLFADREGQPPHQNTIGHRWRRARGVAGVPALKLHDLRHFFASGLIHAGCDVVTVQHALGHAKPTTTLNYYAHLWPTADDRTRNAASQLLAEALGSTASRPASQERG